MKLTDAKIWNSKNASLCQVFANQVTYVPISFVIALTATLVDAYYH